MTTLNIVGRLSQDVKLHNKQNGLDELVYTNNSIVVDLNGVDRTKTKPEYTKTPLFFSFALFGKEAQRFCEWASKGQRIAISGEWQVDYYIDKNGEQRSQDVIRVFQWQVLDKPQEKQNTQTRATNYTQKVAPSQEQTQNCPSDDDDTEMPF